MHLAATSPLQAEQMSGAHRRMAGAVSYSEGDSKKSVGARRGQLPPEYGRPYTILAPP